MLVIKCRLGETLLIGDHVEIAVLGLSQGRVKFGVNAPPEVRIIRKALEVTREQNIASSSIGDPDVLSIIRQCLTQPSSNKGKKINTEEIEGSAEE